MDNSDIEEVEESSEGTLEQPAVVLPQGLRAANVLFMGPVVDGFFQPVPDKLFTPPRWEQGNYRVTAGKWPTASTVPVFTDLTHYNGYYLLIMASGWEDKVISQARIIGVQDSSSGDVISKFAYATMQEKEEEIAVYISGIGN
ncbi:hypothetical protein ACFSKU_20010 [Pontibacter silvestris]|uniref:Uncharacterized protein n=1 Tax=Pontibacter silvestris TaxID=2305183 RepID=A0ABW4X3E6_9BACT|nr:hypothetical protein [Pontibacter silvestris]MCC9134831.1 hypothetical protein [Pontibacter silvestris]